MKPFILLFIFILGSHTVLFGQQRGMTFQEAEAAGIRISDLDSAYQSAVHADTTKAVFKTDRE
ncbi:MAG TPA: hypothetical protein VK183_09355 [Flavobacterium sp.]|nr:hypothetical protein [Flavobacterium sp.]